MSVEVVHHGILVIVQEALISVTLHNDVKNLAAVSMHVLNVNGLQKTSFTFRNSNQVEQHEEILRRSAFLSYHSYSSVSHGY